MKKLLIKVLQFLNLRAKAIIKMKATLRCDQKLSCVSSMQYAEHGTIFLHYKQGSPCDSFHYNKSEMDTFHSDVKVLRKFLS